MRNPDFTLARKFVIASLIVGFCLMCFACPVKEFDKNRPEKEKAEFYAGLHVEVPRYENVTIYRTPGGSTVAAQDPIPADKQAEQFKAVDLAAARALLESENKGWTKMRKTSDLAVLMIRPTCAVSHGPTVGAGCITLRDGRTVAGTTISLPVNNNLKKKEWFDIAVIAQNWDFPQETKIASRNEFQHLITMYNNWQLHLWHSQNDIHPLPEFALPDENEWTAAPILPPSSNFYSQILKARDSLIIKYAR